LKIEMNKLVYITYQTFPSKKANTIQTIENLKYIAQKVNVELIFPNRSKESSGKLSEIQKFYSFNENIKINMTKHNLPFGKINFLEKYLFLFSHLMWARNLAKKLYIKIQNEYIFTRSDWIFFFLSRKNLQITFECHQITKIRKLIIKNSLRNLNSKVICLNENILKDLNIDKKYKDRVIVLHNGVDASNYKKIKPSNKHELVFIGNLRRFNEDRNLNFIINCFKNENIQDKYRFKVIGGPAEALDELDKLINNKGLQDKVELLQWLPRDNVLNEIQKSGIGLLINSNKDKHSIFYTSPLKYFEYLYAGLNVLAVDFPSHKSLPYSENIRFFNDNDEESFINALNYFPIENRLKDNELFNITLEARSLKIINFIRD
tara:strand:- start:766 stop:1893 length:1128 start_codon:yes stop_codon:yes gene_type:complete